jgi:hypothetical protein
VSGHTRTFQEDWHLVLERGRGGRREAVEVQYHLQLYIPINPNLVEADYATETDRGGRSSGCPQVKRRPKNSDR